MKCGKVDVLIAKVKWIIASLDVAAHDKNRQWYENLGAQ